MATVQFKKSAQLEFAKFRQVYGDEAAGRLLKWLEGLAVEEKLSVEFDPEMWLEFSKELGKHWNKWLQSGIVDKVRALLYVVKHKKPPWSFRHSDKTQWTIIDGVMDSVEVWFEANWIESRIIVWKLDVPPRT